MITRYWRSLLIGLLAGICGVGLSFLVLHLWQDHQQLHALINWANTIIAEQAKQAAPVK